MTPESLARTIAKARYGTEEHWAAMLPAARAVVEVLMDPSDAMIEAGAKAASRNDVDFRVDDVIPYAECDNCFRAEWRGEVVLAFRAMLHALLAQPNGAQ